MTYDGEHLFRVVEVLLLVAPLDTIQEKILMEVDQLKLYGRESCRGGIVRKQISIDLGVESRWLLAVLCCDRVLAA